MNAQRDYITDKRQQERYAVSLAATLELLSDTVSVYLINLSLSGLLIRFPFASRTYDLDHASEIRIPEIGVLSVEMIWTSGDRAGFRFTDLDRAKGIVGKFLNKNTPDPY